MEMGAWLPSVECPKWVDCVEKLWLATNGRIGTLRNRRIFCKTARLAALDAMERDAWRRIFSVGDVRVVSKFESGLFQHNQSKTDSQPDVRKGQWKSHIKRHKVP